MKEPTFARKGPNIINKIIHILLLTSLCLFTSADDTAVTTVKAPKKQVLVEVNNPIKLNFQLFLLESVKIKSLVEFKGLPTNHFLVPEGRYTIKVKKDEQIHWVAVPALFSSTAKPLIISLNNFHSLDKDFAWIPPGPTIIGDTLGIGAEDERPVQVLDIPGFYIGTLEVTNQQYAKFLNDQLNFKQNWIDLSSRKCGIEKAPSNLYKPKKGFETLPVVMVSYYGAKAYCQWLTKTTEAVHRLPTEQEWEKAARGPKLSVYAYGDIYTQSKANQESGKLKPVGSFVANDYGLFDMTGNAFEWMSNLYDPNKPDNTTMNQALRGGSFVLDGMYLRNSFRMRQSPEVMTDDIGFRVVRELPSDQ